MFGYVRPVLETLKDEEKARYQAVYCGLCQALGQRYGLAARGGVTYDMTFLALLLSSLYEPTEQQYSMRCLHHRCKQEVYMANEMINYAADLTVAFMYHKCADNWRDDHNIASRGYQAMLKKAYRQAKLIRPKEVEKIEKCMRTITALEKVPEAAPEAVVNLFSTLLGELLVVRQDQWADALKMFGCSLGKFVYMMDATIDYDDDSKKGNPNPVAALELTPERMESMLEMMLAPAAEAFERLPLVKDIELLRNTLYSGVWQDYHRMMQKRKGEAKHG
ncbi:MAG: hypothetical protein J6K99_08625 [Peptococcaceae bacterium]|nr:hypothetical protein [Peptococcaceae bacterium]MBO5430107.1 hypothetical protein [Peptococcaceae bacterium]MBP3342572.1 hypothetical protein [Peptococcaceae bacterium]MBP3626048.1 hypothetical protein [Peptococcaceae bacterium]